MTTLVTGIISRRIDKLAVARRDGCRADPAWPQGSRSGRGGLKRLKVIETDRLFPPTDRQKAVGGIHVPGWLDSCISRKKSAASSNLIQAAREPQRAAALLLQSRPGGLEPRSRIAREMGVVC